MYLYLWTCHYFISYSKSITVFSYKIINCCFMFWCQSIVFKVNFNSVISFSLICCHLESASNYKYMLSFVFLFVWSIFPSFMLTFCKHSGGKVLYIISCSKNVWFCTDRISTIVYHGEEHPFDVQSSRATASLGLKLVKHFVIYFYSNDSPVCFKMC